MQNVVPCPRSTGSGDLRLIAAVLGGDLEASDLFADRMACIPNLISSRLRRRGIQPQPAEIHDLSQDVFAAVWQRLPDYRGEGPLEAWVYGFVARVTLASTRRFRARTTSPHALETLEARELEEPSLDDDSQRLLDLISSLRASDRRVLELRYEAGLDLAAMAKRLGCSERAARARLERSKRRLRDLVEPSDARGGGLDR